MGRRGFWPRWSFSRRSVVMSISSKNTTRKRSRSFLFMAPVAHPRTGKLFLPGSTATSINHGFSIIPPVPRLIRCPICCSGKCTICRANINLSSFTLLLTAWVDWLPALSSLTMGWFFHLSADLFLYQPPGEERNWQQAA